MSVWLKTSVEEVVMATVYWRGATGLPDAEPPSQPRTSDTAKAAASHGLFVRKIDAHFLSMPFSMKLRLSHAVSLSQTRVRT